MSVMCKKRPCSFWGPLTSSNSKRKDRFQRMAYWWPELEVRPELGVTAHLQCLSRRAATLWMLTSGSIEVWQRTDYSVIMWKSHRALHSTWLVTGLRANIVSINQRNEDRSTRIDHLIRNWTNSKRFSKWLGLISNNNNDDQRRNTYDIQLESYKDV